MKDLESFLRSLALESCLPAFAEEGIDDVETLAELTDGDLAELGLKLGPRRKLLKALRELEAADSGLSEILGIITKMHLEAGP